jgi:hypothetical protein
MLRRYEVELSGLAIVDFPEPIEFAEAGALCSFS